MLFSCRCKITFSGSQRKLFFIILSLSQNELIELISNSSACLQQTLFFSSLDIEAKAKKNLCDAFICKEKRKHQKLVSLRKISLLLKWPQLNNR